MAPRSFGPNYPRTAYLLTLIGAIFIILGGIVEAAIFAAIGSALVGIGFAGIGALLIAFAVIALLFGVIVLYGAMKLKSSPQSAKTWGILIVVFALISFIGGGGFYIGAILALVGGILAIVWVPPAVAPSGYGQPLASPTWAQPPPPPGPPPMGAPGQRFCSYCGSANAPGAQFCAKCGAALTAQ